MKDLERLSELYGGMQAKGHAHLSHRMGLLSVYDEGWGEGRFRGIAEALEFIERHQASTTHWTGAVEAAREHFEASMHEGTSDD